MVGFGTFECFNVSAGTHVVISKRRQVEQQKGGTTSGYYEKGRRRGQTKKEPFNRRWTLTYGYLAAMNAGVVLWPRVLSYDWQMGSVPLVHSVLDVRNLSTLALAVFLVGLLRRILHENFRSLLVYPSTSAQASQWPTKGDSQAEGHHANSNAQYRIGAISGERGEDDDAVDDKGGAASPRNDAGPLLLMGATLLVLPWLPASNLLVTVGFVLAERVLYIPSMGFCLLVVEGLRRLLPHLRDGTSTSCATQCVKPSGWRRSFSRRQKFMLLALFFLLCLGMIRTVRRNRVWRSREALFTSGIREMPTNCKMHYNYANLQRDLGRSEGAELHYKIALSLAVEPSANLEGGRFSSCALYKRKRLSTAGRQWEPESASHVAVLRAPLGLSLALATSSTDAGAGTAWTRLTKSVPFFIRFPSQGHSGCVFRLHNPTGARPQTGPDRSNAVGFARQELQAEFPAKVNIVGIELTDPPRGHGKLNGRIQDVVRVPRRESDPAFSLLEGDGDVRKVANVLPVRVRHRSLNATAAIRAESPR
ncbi:transmembrane and TPR repeat-containing protein 1-like [Tropilaelaps mercedesae]|uniref:Transmembrane and TPR repeat-containing protein 1-like n=1 Tax=Tropilaelaps mercedesae TaxID=418985 RepID=A0A1V9WZ56_9ACAR|nr:transmembrane and TPR repeat-containing protein 1-like [Tropilaelaps mercedesae]